MKKKSQSTIQDFKMPHLFREDLEELENILKEVSVREYKLESQNFEYENVDEISKDLGITNKFYIQTHSPYISIHFNCNGSYIYTEDNDIKTIGAVKKIIIVISKRERKTLYWLSKLSVSLAPMLFCLPVSMMIFLEISKEVAVLSIILLPIIAIVWWIIGYNSSFKKFSIIEFAYRKDRVTFFIRNKDQIIFKIIWSLLCILGTILFQKYII